MPLASVRPRLCKRRLTWSWWIRGFSPTLTGAPGVIRVSVKKIADMTRARYFHATSAEDLKAVYDVLSRQLVVETREMEITAFFAALAALFMAAAAGLSLTWFHRIF